MMLFIGILCRKWGFNLAESLGDEIEDCIKLVLFRKNILALSSIIELIREEEMITFRQTRLSTKGSVLGMFSRVLKHLAICICVLHIIHVEVELILCSY